MRLFLLQIAIFLPLQAYLRFCGLAHEVKCRRNAEFMSPTGVWFVICIVFGGRISYPELAIYHLDNVLS